MSRKNISLSAFHIAMPLILDHKDFLHLSPQSEIAYDWEKAFSAVVTHLQNSLLRYINIYLYFPFVWCHYLNYLILLDTCCSIFIDFKLCNFNTLLSIVCVYHSEQLSIISKPTQTLKFTTMSKDGNLGLRTAGWGIWELKSISHKGAMIPHLWFRGTHV